MVTDRIRHNRRLWAWFTFFGSVGCLGASALIWISHYLEFVATGHVHHRSLATVLGVDAPALELALCLMLPLLGLAFLYAFVAVWSVGVYRGHPPGKADIDPPAGAMSLPGTGSANGD